MCVRNLGRLGQQQLAGGGGATQRSGAWNQTKRNGRASRQRPPPTPGSHLAAAPSDAKAAVGGTYTQYRKKCEQKMGLMDFKKTKKEKKSVVILPFQILSLGQQLHRARTRRHSSSVKQKVAFRFVQEGPTKASRRGGKNAARSRRLRISAREPNGTGSVAPARAPCGESSCGCARPRGIFRRWRTRQRGEGRGGSGWGPGGERGIRRRRCLARADVAGIFAPAVAASRRATRWLADRSPLS